MKLEPLTIGDDELARLIEAGESARVEFKETLKGDAPKRIREAVCAFANDATGAGAPGVVVIGLTDTGAPSGFRVDDEALRRLTDIGSDGNILPLPALSVEKRRYSGAEIAVLAVRPSDSPPVRYKGRAHVRNGPRNGIANEQEERILNERRRAGNSSFDISPVPGSGIRDLDRARFEGEYLPAAVSAETLEENERSYEQRLAATKMIASADDQRATVLGLLTIGIAPRDFFPGSYIQFLRIRGRELADAANGTDDEAVIDGSVSDMMRILDAKLDAHNRRRTDFVDRARERLTDTYPMEALRQFARNAVMHRIYEGTNAPVRVTWFDDRIEIQNPGGPYGAVTAANFGQPGVTDYRNPELAAAMRVPGYVQRFGAGIPTARRLLKKAGHPDPEFSVYPTHVLVTVKTAAGRNGDER